MGESPDEGARREVAIGCSKKPRVVPGPPLMSSLNQLWSRSLTAARASTQPVTTAIVCWWKNEVRWSRPEVNSQTYSAITIAAAISTALGIWSLVSRTTTNIAKQTTSAIAIHIIHLLSNIYPGKHQDCPEES